MLCTLNDRLRIELREGVVRGRIEQPQTHARVEEGFHGFAQCCDVDEALVDGGSDLVVQWVHALRPVFYVTSYGEI